MKNVDNLLFRALGLIVTFLVLSAPVFGQSTRDSTKTVAFKANINKSGDYQDSNPSITLELDRVPLREALKRIAGQAEAGLYYNVVLLPDKTVSLRLKAIPLSKALRKVLAGTTLRVVTSGRNITLRPKRETHQMHPLLTNIQETIIGTVTDASTGNTLPGVNIGVKGTSTGTATDANGQYELTVESLQDTLVFSFVGYQTQQVPIKGRTKISIKMKTQAISGKEMVVVGYGTQQKSNLTGSVSQISSKAIELQPVNSATQALQGLAPGLNVGVNQSGGASDASMDINIRGTGSLSGSEPYIVIDGVRATQAEFSNLNPNDIKTISVLKDAASAAIYGSHAAYGAIVVKTKTGTKNQGFTVNYSNNFRFEQLMAPSSVSSVEYAKVGNQAGLNFTGQKLFSEKQIAKMRAFMKGDLKYSTAPDPNNSNWWLGIKDGSAGAWASGFANTNWWDVMAKDIELTQKHNLSIRGGSDNITYYLSGGFLKDPGQFKYGDKNESYSKYNLNSNVSANVTNWLKISNITRFSRTGAIFPNSLSGQGKRWRTFHDISRMPPLVPYKTPPVKDSQGNIIVPEQLAQVAAWNENDGFNKYTVNNLVSTLKADLDITKSFNIKGDFTFKKYLRNGTFNFKEWQFIGPDGQPEISYINSRNKINQAYKKTNYISSNIYGHYNKTFWDDHNFNILVGYQQEENNTSELSVGRKNVLNNNLNSTNIAIGDIVGLNNPITSWSTMGAFGRFQYNYKQKYLLEFNGRYDGSSRFAPGHRFVFSPSVSIGYKMDKEKYWNSIRKYINKFKIRASWGKLGNQEVSNYLFRSSIPIYTRLPYLIGETRPSYTNMANIRSPNITWETSATKDIGADLSFLNNRLTVSGDYYDRDTDNMFAPTAALPAVLGTSPPQTNSASLKTTGWEFSLEWQDHFKNNLSYHVKVMASNNQTTITKYNNPTKVLNGLLSDINKTGESAPSNLYSGYYVGEKLGDIWGYKTDGLFQSEKEVNDYLSKVDLSYLGSGWQPGDVKYEDLNGDGKVNEGNVTANNSGDLRVIGNDHPRYQFSILAGGSWHNFNISMLWKGVGKREIWLDDTSFIFWGWSRMPFTHLTKANLNYWSKDNPDGYFPEPLAENGKSGYDKNRNVSTRYLQNGAYIRLQSLQLGYTLPSSLSHKLNIKKLKFFINGQNLVTITNMFSGIDPALSAVRGRIYSTPSGGGRTYPLARTYGVGVNISF